MTHAYWLGPHVKRVMLEIISAHMVAVKTQIPRIQGDVSRHLHQFISAMFSLPYETDIICVLQMQFDVGVLSMHLRGVFHETSASPQHLGLYMRPQSVRESNRKL